MNSGSDPTYQEEYYKQYFYHSNHLGSASLISDYKGDEYQRIEYTPYGETWVEKTSNTGLEFLPYKFTAKELDKETGLYYYGARYLDPKYSRWISADPALGEYMQGSAVGEGGIYNSLNLSLYHYGSDNPIRYTDPTGLNIDDWQDNGDGTWTVKSEGARLWDIWGADSYNATGLTEDEARNIHVGDTFGQKIGNNPVIAENILQLAPIQETPRQNQIINNGYYSKTVNFLIGLGEVVSGVSIIIGGGFAAAALAPETMGGSAMIGYDAAITGGVIFAYGLTRTVGVNNKPFGEDVKNILVPPMAAFVDIDSKEFKP
ncbi:MAG: RHS repeat-associated core domain-containing protein [Treponema sp.]|nr:RHS repeat-associated core domain-containing protein [Treponema sp.]